MAASNVKSLEGFDPTTEETVTWAPVNGTANIDARHVTAVLEAHDDVRQMTAELGLAVGVDD